MNIINRRRFLQVGSLASAAVMMPKFLKALERGELVPPGNKVLVIVQLSGGNDGLNTIIPYRNDIYYKQRPNLGIKRDKALSLTDELGIHPGLVGLKALYDEGALGVLNNVGYPNPDRSHFRSMDIWHTASQSSDYWTNGWIGRYLDAQCKGCDKPTQALEIDDTLSLALKGESSKGLALTDPTRLYGTSNNPFFKDLLKQQAHDDEHQNVDYLYKTMGETISSAAYIQQQIKTYQSKEAYPNTELGKNMRTIANLIMSDINTKVYYVSHGSFDTHVNQQAQQDRLFQQLSDALTVFTGDLKKNNRFQDVVVMTFSEFGRRVSQNASGGTDHGTANNMFLIGGGLKEKGVLNEGPDLMHLKDGDLQYKVDFKSVYATLLGNWLGADDADILKAKYDHLNFV
ncbi:Uncharacterized conserved protein, DUF1501 family [Chitinophaga jiangningensis]|uniref:Uncharacterized conserved protein, DUF1501 family n=1 Tax=Chitinophaga jiangningensis TaxID=1419482 RepID=A0A1M6X2Q6_9BACT|nr:DUF1501 domain-containing protein [Chitinophaga jiangningensis]SHL00213.1 Uncharacterized conserved protein, DUF1501 family [Chitinophaga jiangningensis]